MNHYETIKTLFEPPPPISAAVNQSFPKEKNTVIIGVHLRRGDYKTYKNGIYYYTDEVYAHFMNQLQETIDSQGKKAWFFLCSNESISHDLTSGYQVVQLPQNDYLTDLYALSCCDLIIGPPSTFSQWASFIGKVPLKFVANGKENIAISDFKYILSIDRFNSHPIAQDLSDVRV